MKIGELSRETGVAVRLLRYYEAQGLLTSQRSEGGHRHYAPEAPVAVARIRTLLAAGLPTRVIRDLMPCFTGDGTGLQACVLDHLRGRLDELDSRMAELAQARKALSDILETSTRALAHA
ncbi:MerR family transcriptional regulator [Planomonospora sp. ID91781]|uniref:MerR family transcriptional regulator n=1 Tax=Planomonospora sphaerica TaxID=161355 RepID=A0A171DGT1_9ACTN|nr:MULTISPECIES: MerR family transcriptional regulator [Planomonospora]MBG0824761.1 MerR family transcriptional regulator [Planomonospora sp. ID91781]GAT68400.1 merR family transcriptional regulator [Planomonospora sphaerica]